MSDAFLPISYSIVGVQKAATSTLHSLLVRHRQIAQPARKELHFFDDEKADWDNRDFSDYRVARTAPAQRIAGDSTPVYLFWPRALERMRAHNPDMKLIASFRDPIDRAFSHWMMQVTRRDAKAASFPDFDELATDWTLPEPVVDEMPSAWRGGRLRTFSAVPRGFYGAQVERGLALFPREQWLFIDFLDVVKDQAAVCQRLTDFLGVAPYRSLPADRRRHPTPPVTDRPAPSPEVLERLAQGYAEDLALFERLTGIDTSAWTTRQLLDGRLAADDLAVKLHRKATQAG